MQTLLSSKTPLSGIKLNKCINASFVSMIRVEQNCTYISSCIVHPINITDNSIDYVQSKTLTRSEFDIFPTTE